MDVRFTRLRIERGQGRETERAQGSRESMCVRERKSGKD